MDTRGTLVLGCPRSGTTLLRRLIDAHPEFACPGETLAFRSLVRLLEDEPLDRGVRYGLVPGLAQAGLDAKAVRDDLRALAFAWMDAIAARHGKPRWAEKTAVTAFHVPALVDWLGDRVRYVVVLRHGLDVACSLVDLVHRSGGFLTELHRYVRDEPRLLWAMARAWCDVTTDLLDLADADPTVVVVRYEQLVAEPRSVLTELFADLGASGELDSLEAALERGTPGFGDWKTWERGAIDDRSVGRHRRLDPATLAAIAPLVDPVLARAGYAPVVVQPPPDAERRAALAHRLAALKARPKG